MNNIERCNCKKKYTRISTNDSIIKVVWIKTKLKTISFSFVSSLGSFEVNTSRKWEIIKVRTNIPRITIKPNTIHAYTTKASPYPILNHNNTKAWSDHRMWRQTAMISNSNARVHTTYNFDRDLLVA